MGFVAGNTFMQHSQNWSFSSPSYLSNNLPNRLYPTTFTRHAPPHVILHLSVHLPACRNHPALAHWSPPNSLCHCPIISLFLLSLGSVSKSAGIVITFHRISSRLCRSFEKSLFLRYASPFTTVALPWNLSLPHFTPYQPSNHQLPLPHLDHVVMITFC